MLTSIKNSAEETYCRQILSKNRIWGDCLSSRNLQDVRLSYKRILPAFASELGAGEYQCLGVEIFNRSVMSEQKENKTKIVFIRVSQTEYDKLQRQFKKTTCKRFSHYTRKKLLDKHVVEFYRNQSLDDFMTAMLDLQKELNAIGNNFNQIVKRIYTLKGFDAFQQWYIELSIDRKQVLNQVEKINRKLGEISDEWLR